MCTCNWSFNPATFYWSACTKPWKCICAGVSILLLSTILILDFGIVQTVFYVIPYYYSLLGNLVSL